jgi:hypothetical protein
MAPSTRLQNLSAVTAIAFANSVGAALYMGQKTVSVTLGFWAEHPAFAVTSIAVGLGFYAVPALVSALAILAVRRFKTFPRAIAVFCVVSTALHIVILPSTSQNSPAARQAEEFGVPDPVSFIDRAGYDTVGRSDDGSTVYTKDHVAAPEELNKLRRSVAGLSKNQDIFNACNFMRGGIKAGLIEYRGLPFDLVLVDYGHAGPTIACSWRLLLGSESGAIYAFYRLHRGAMYSVFVRDERIR